MKKLFILICIILPGIIYGQGMHSRRIAASGGGDCSNTNYGDETTNTTNNYVYTTWNTYMGTITVGAGEVQSVQLYIGATADATSMYAAIYENNGGVPGDLVTNGVSNELTSISTSSWHSFTFSTNPELTAGDYWISIARNGTNEEITSGSAGGGYTVRDEVWSGSFPSTSSSGAWITDAYISCYIVVCVN
jgi:hypothetical protein